MTTPFTPVCFQEGTTRTRAHQVEKKRFENSGEHSAPSNTKTASEPLSSVYYLCPWFPIPLIEELSGTIADDDQMVFPERIDSVAHDPKQAYQTWTQERACVPFEW